MRRPHLLTSALVVCGSIAFTAPVQAQGGRSGHYFNAWESLPWSALEARARCDGGPVGVTGGPISWTVQFHNRGKIPVSFNYQLSNTRSEKQGQPPAKGRTTLKANGVLERLVSLRTDSCEDTPSIGLNKVRFGVDADSVPYTPADRRS
jgi:hypothetical protein